MYLSKARKDEILNFVSLKLSRKDYAQFVRMLAGEPPEVKEAKIAAVPMPAVVMEKAVPTPHNLHPSADKASRMPKYRRMSQHALRRIGYSVVDIALIHKQKKRREKKR